MRLPWVSREAYEQLQRISGAAIADIGKVLGAEQKRYDLLLEKYHALKLQGAVPASIVGVLNGTAAASAMMAEPSAATPLDPRVALFLDAKFVAGTPLWRQQYGEARKLMAAGADAEKIIETLGRGQTVEF